MPDVFLPAVDPVDISYDNDNSTVPAPDVPPAGGLLGDGDLTSNDGDTTGWEAWDSNGASTFDPGTDAFSYTIDTTPLPVGATITSYRYELTVRVLAESDPQNYALAGLSPSWGGAGYSMPHWDGDPFTYQTVISTTRATTPTFLEQIAAGTAEVIFGAVMRNTNTTSAASPVRCTMAGLRVYYTETDPPPTSTVYGIPALRQLQRGDGYGMSGAPRAIQNRSQQATLRNIGFQ